jgi:hypothetical protein
MGDVEIFPGGREGLRRIPKLTTPERLVLDAILVSIGGEFDLGRFKYLGWDHRYRGKRLRPNRRILRQLLKEGLIEVMGLGPAVYRLTKPGRVARSLGVRS